MVPRLSLAEARLTVLTHQGFPPRPRAPVAVLEQAGFVRTLGGVDAYLALRARAGDLDRAVVDDALARHDVQVVPAVRGCIYLVARRHAGLCLRIAAALTAERDAREHARAGIGPGELDQLGRTIREVLARAPLTTDALRKTLPAGAVRSLGEAGKKLGIATPLPAALRRLELDGVIERVPDEHRLDHERYRWRVAARSVFDVAPVPATHEARIVELARIYYRAAGLAPLAAFAAWAGVSQREARPVVDALGLEPVEIDGLPGGWLRLPGASADPASASAVALLAFEDGAVALPGGPGLLVDAAHHALPVPVWGSSKTVPLGEARFLSLRPILAEGRIAGFWEYDPDHGTIVTGLLGPGLSAAARRGLDEAVDRTARFLREDLGHGRSFSLDTDPGLRERAALIARLTGGGSPARRASSKTRR